MGLGHDSQSYDEDFQIAIDSTGKAGHGLPLTNFLNAQCLSHSLFVVLIFRLRNSGYWYTTTRIQSRSRYRKFKSLGSFIEMYFYRMLSSFEIRFFNIFNVQAEWI